MPSVRKNKNDKQGLRSKPIFRYWIELLDLRNGSTRDLPLKVLTRIHLSTKRNQAQRPNEVILQLEDGAAILEAKDLDELAAQLRQRYPDGSYERRLHSERDLQAEARWEHGMNQLIEIIAKSAYEELCEAAVSTEPSDTSPK
jgi:hypothetical protein